jgi:hypothetical protein
MFWFVDAMRKQQQMEEKFRDKQICQKELFDILTDISRAVFLVVEKVAADNATMFEHITKHHTAEM